MSGRQLDLFSAGGLAAEDHVVTPAERNQLVPGNLDDAALITALPVVHLADCLALCAEAGRRRLIAAIPALEALCRRFKGFGLERAVPEQIAALRCFAEIGAPEAAAAVERIIVNGVVQGPGLLDAVLAAVRLGCFLPVAISLVLLRHDDAQVRSVACRCVRPHQQVVPLLVDLLDDLHRPVVVAPACALGRAGRNEARPILTHLLREDPTEEVIDAVSSVADEDCIVQLGRIARSNPGLAGAANDALNAIDNPRAKAVAAAVHRTA